jgi:hypothetical protein
MSKYTVRKQQTQWYGCRTVFRGLAYTSKLGRILVILLEIFIDCLTSWPYIDSGQVSRFRRGFDHMSVPDVFVVAVVALNEAFSSSTSVYPLSVFHQRSTELNWIEWYLGSSPSGPDAPRP